MGEWRFVVVVLAAGVLMGLQTGSSLANSEFIAEARTDVPALCRELRAAWQERDQARRWATAWKRAAKTNRRVRRVLNETLSRHKALDSVAAIGYSLIVAA